MRSTGKAGRFLSRESNLSEGVTILITKAVSANILLHKEVLAGRFLAVKLEIDDPSFFFV